MLVEYLTAVALIFVAEMGDKTQILAMAFATKYKIRQVLMGIFIGSFLNHGLAVILGSALSNVIPITLLQIIAGVSFVGFALWTLKLDDDEEEDAKANYGPLLTVALAFFIGELGDKTQLTAIVLSTDATYPFLILLGTVTGMVITGGLGIYVGSKLGAKIPEFTIQMVSATVFMLFGILKLYNYLPAEYITVYSVIGFTVVIGLAAYFILRPTLALRRAGQTAYQRSAQRLYDFYNELKKEIEDICLSENICGNCRLDSCIIGATKHMLQNQTTDFTIDFETTSKKFDRIKVIRSLESILEFLDTHEGSNIVFEVKNNLENILLNQTIEYKNKADYMSKLKEISPEVARYFNK